MQSNTLLNLLKAQLSFKDGINKFHYAILIMLTVLIILFFLNGEQEAPTSSTSLTLTPAVLKALRDQNLDKRLEYAESMPIIRNMTKHLKNFEKYLPTRPKKAYGELLVVKRRFSYLDYKDLEVSNAQKILYEYIDNHKKMMPK